MVIASTLATYIGLYTAVFALAFAVALAAVIRLIWVLPMRIRGRPAATLHSHFRRADQCRLMVVMGSGGHTSEMQTLLRGLQDHQFEFKDIVYVVADTDRTSTQKLLRDNTMSRCTVDTIPRSREVGQSYLSSIITTLISIPYSAYVVLKRKPDVVLCNGPGTCVPIIFAAFLWNYFGCISTSTVFVESLCRVETLSLSGKLLYPVVDGFFIQWPELHAK